MSKRTVSEVYVDEAPESIKMFRALCTVEGIADKEVTAFIKENNLSTVKVSFIDSYYPWLREGARSAVEVESYLLTWCDGDKEKNVYKHLSHYCRIAELANGIHRDNSVD